MAIISISDSQINSADGVLVADASSKIPAKDGSQIIILNATNVSSGTIATARLDTGTTANKIVILDGSGNLPVVDGSLLTGVSAATVSASDPTISTNPSGGVGTEWNNSTSGEMYICTDATAGANVWKNVGAGSGDIEWLQTWFYGGDTYGFAAGGQTATDPGWGSGWYVSNRISRFAFASGNASDFGSDLAVAVRYNAGASSSTHGYSVAGLKNAAPYPVDHIQKYALASSANATDVGNASAAKEGMQGHNSETYGYHSGGWPAISDIGKWAFASDGNSTDVGDLTSTGSFAPAASDALNSYGYTTLGGVTQNILKFSFTSDGNAVDTTQDLFRGVSHASSFSSNTHGYAAGGNEGPPPVTSEYIQKWAFNSSSNGTDVGNMHTPTNYMGMTHPCSLTYGYSCGGSPVGGGATNTIQKTAFASDGDSTDHADLTEIVYAPSFAQL
jgi:hypothetical protein